MVLLFSSVSVNAQIPDNTDGRLYRLCKVWGYQKYFSQHGGEYLWDSLLNIAIEKVLIAKNQNEFNKALLSMLNEVPNNVQKEPLGAMPDTNLNLDLNWLDDEYFSAEVKEYLTTFRNNVVPDTCTGLIESSGGITNITKESVRIVNGPQSWNYLTESHRLNIFFYLWNIINYFYPYKNLMDVSWDTTLMNFIPRFRAVNSKRDYHVMILRLMTKLNDTHGFASSSQIDYFWEGNYIPKIYFARAENKCVAAKVSEDYPEIQQGDILLKINGRPVDSIETEFRELIPASNEAAFYRDFYWYMLRGIMDTYIDLTLQDRNGQEYEKRVYRDFDMFAMEDWVIESGRPESYYIADCGYGYLDMFKLKTEELPQMWELLKNTPAIIIDLRKYPMVNLRDLLPYFFEKPITSAKILSAALTSVSDSMYHYPGWFYIWDDSENYTPWQSTDIYQGKILILVNQATQSYMEYDCQYLSFHPRAKVIGSQTAGADGNVLQVYLPYTFLTGFTGLGWYYADWYQQQRNGVRIDTIVNLTIDGIRKGKDEILLAALDCINDVQNENFKGYVEIYPNPFTDKANIEFNLTAGTNINIVIFDNEGNYIRNIGCDDCKKGLNIVEWDGLDAKGNKVPTGMYYCEVLDGYHRISRKMIRMK